MPFKILQACSELIHTGNTTTASIAITSATAALTAANKTGFLTEGGSASSSSQLSSLGVSLRQQLEQSGLLQQLPALLTSTAEKLEDTVGAATLGQDTGPSENETAGWHAIEEQR